MQLVSWFKGLTTLGRAAVISGGVMGATIVGATAQQPTDPVLDSTSEQVNQQKVEAKSTPKVTTRVETETQDIPFSETAVNDSQLAKGETRVVTEGLVGEKIITHSITETDGVETDRVSSEEVSRQPVGKVVAVGTYEAPVKKCDPNYSGGCVPIVSYDLDCADIGFRVTVVGRDVHRFDRDKDGYGCESYR